MSENNYKITLIIPFLNEAATIEDVFKGIEVQTLIPDEIIFVDAGSIDNTQQLITSWNQNNSYECKILSCPNAMPGKARNFGIRNSKHNLIAFLDSGILPEPDWLSLLLQELKSTGGNGAWGTCIYEGHSPLAKMVSAYSFGNFSKIEYFLAGSLFAKETFEKIGYFEEHLRAAEDLIWREKYLNEFSNTKSSEAYVRYTRFPTSIFNVLKKWNLYAEHTAIASVQKKQQLFYFLFFLSLVAGGSYEPYVGSFIFLTYVILRGIIDPIRRSKHLNWWGRDIYLPIIGPSYVFLLDLAKCMGFLKGNFNFLFK
jgi:glycosyltransferase involved in cell wall biosynthesis